MFQLGFIFLFPLILTTNSVPRDKLIFTKRSYDSLHEYPDHQVHQSNSTLQKIKAQNSTLASENNIKGANYQSEEILTAVYEATKQLPDFDSNLPQIKPSERFAFNLFDFKKKDGGKKFSISDLFEKAGHNLASKLFGIKDEHAIMDNNYGYNEGGNYAKRKILHTRQSYPSETPKEDISAPLQEYPSNQPEYNNFSPNYETQSQEGPYGYTVVYTKGEQITNTYNDYKNPPIPSYSSTPSYPQQIYHQVTPSYHATSINYPTRTYKERYKENDKKCSDEEVNYKNIKSTGSRRKEMHQDYGDYGGMYGGGEMGYGGGNYGYSSGGGELVHELKDKLKSLFMLVLPLVPVALILATLFPSSVFIPARSGTTFLPLNGTGGINIMQLTPGTQTNIPARRVNAKQEFRSADFAKKLKDAEERAEPVIRHVLELAQNSGILNGTMSELVKSLSPLFVKHTRNILAMSSDDVLSPKMKALVMDKILRRVGQDLLMSIRQHESSNPPKVKKVNIDKQIKNNSLINQTSSEEKIKAKTQIENTTSTPFSHIFKMVPYILGLNKGEFSIDSILNVIRIANNNPEMVSSILGSMLDLVLPNNAGSKTLKQVAMTLLNQFSNQVKLQSTNTSKTRKRRSNKNEENESYVLASLENSLRSILLGDKEENDDQEDGKEESFAEKAFLTWNNIRDKFRKFITRGNDDPSCLQRIICQTASMGREDDASLPQRVMWKIVNRLMTVAPSQFGIRSLMTNAKSGRCYRYKCPISKLGSLFF